MSRRRIQPGQAGHRSGSPLVSPRTTNRPAKRAKRSASRRSQQQRMHPRLSTPAPDEGFPVVLATVAVAMRGAAQSGTQYCLQPRCGLRSADVVDPHLHTARAPLWHWFMSAGVSRRSTKSEFPGNPVIPCARPAECLHSPRAASLSRRLISIPRIGALLCR